MVSGEADEALEYAAADFTYDDAIWAPSHAAATVIQRHWRGFVGRWAALHKRALYTAAAEVIQVRLLELRSAGRPSQPPHCRSVGVAARSCCWLARSGEL